MKCNFRRVSIDIETLIPKGKEEEGGGVYISIRISRKEKTNQNTKGRIT